MLLLLAERGGHAYELEGRLRSLGFEWRTRPGPAYDDLRDMAKDGLVRSSIDVRAHGPARRVYELTDIGWQALDVAANDVEELGTLVNDFRRRYTDRPYG